MMARKEKNRPGPKGFRRRLYRCDPGDLERILVGLSGPYGLARIHQYQARIDTIYHRFLARTHLARRIDPGNMAEYDALETAENLFNYLWNVKPRRFGSAYRLSEVVDNHLSGDPHRRVGNCIGLTSLFAVLAARAGLQLRLLVGSDHLLCRLRLSQRVIDIDPTDPDGFDTDRCGGSYVEKEMIRLSANVLNSRGLEHEAAGRLREALSDFNAALKLDCGYASVYNNRANLYRKLGRLRKAEEDYTRALACRPDFQEAFCNRGMVRELLGDGAGAVNDYRRGAALDPEDRLARRLCRRIGELHPG